MRTVSAVVLLSAVLADVVVVSWCKCEYSGGSSYIINPWYDDGSGKENTVNVADVTQAFLTGQNATDHLDATPYVEISTNPTTGQVTFKPNSVALLGILDYPNPQQSSRLQATCNLVCGNDTGTFDLTVFIEDINTAKPRFNQPTYTASVIETMPPGIPLPQLTITASDDDRDAAYHEVSFSLDDHSVFELTPRVQTPDAEPTYTVQLQLKTDLDWYLQQNYSLIVTASDNNGLSSTATVTITVEDVDTMQPSFTQPFYQTTIEDPTAVGPLDVDVKAVDPDSGGPLMYQLDDPAQAGWSQYFGIQSSEENVTVILKQDITDKLLPSESTVTLLITAKESAGKLFSCSAALAITLPALPVTTTTPMPTSTSTVTTTSPETSTTPMTTPETTPSSPVTTPETTPSSPVTTPETTPSSPVTTPETTSSAGSTTPGPTPGPPQPPLFRHRETYVNTSESTSGVILKIAADTDIKDITYHILTPSYEDTFSLAAETGELNKTAYHNYGTVNLLVQGVYPGNSPKDMTERTDVVDWDETLVVIHIEDVNDHRPQLSIAAQLDPGTKLPVVGYRASDATAYPQYLTSISATDEDAGVFGEQGIIYRSGLDFAHVDTDGTLWLVKQPEDAARSLYVEAKDNNGVQPYQSATITLWLVPVSDSQLFYISSDVQLTDISDVTSLLNEVKQAGGYTAVYASEFPQAGSTSESAVVTAVSADSERSQLLIYAIENAAQKPHESDLRAVDKDSMAAAISKMSGQHNVRYLGTQNERCSGVTESESDVAVVVLAVVLGIVIVGFIIMFIYTRKRIRSAQHADTSAEDRQDFNSHQPSPYRDLYTGASGTVANSAPIGAPYQAVNTAVGFDNPAYEDKRPDQVGLRDLNSPHTEEDHFIGASAPALDQAPLTSTFTPYVPTLPPAEEFKPAVSEPDGFTSLQLNPVTSAAPTTATAASATTRVVAPAEPVPDYSTKSVGFNETVLCVAAEEEEVSSDEEATEQAEELVQRNTEGDGSVTTRDEHGAKQSVEGTSHIYPSLEGVEKDGDEDIVHL